MRSLVPALISLTLITTPVIAQDDGGGFLENLIEDNLSGAGRDVRITGFAGALSSEASLDELTIADEDGVWLTLRDVVLNWNRSALLRGRLEVNALTAAEIILPRLPGSDPEAPTPEATPFSLPELPVSIQIEEVSVARVELGAALFGTAAVVSLDGSVSLDGGAGSADIAVERVDDRQGALTLAASYENVTEALSINLNLTEEADGIAANLLGLPGTPSVRLEVDGAGPLSDFTADIELDTDEQRRLAGTVALTATETDGETTRGFTADIGGDIAPVFAPQYRPFFGPDIRLSTSGQTLPQGGFQLDTLDLTARALRLSGQVSIGADGLPDLIGVTGRIAQDTGEPVLLPVAEAVEVDSLDLAVQFDASQSEDWSADIALNGFSVPNLTATRIALTGTGLIQNGAGSQSVTAALELAAQGLSAQDPAVAQALGDQLEGAAELRWTSGAPIVLDRLRLGGESFDFDGAGQVAFGDGTSVTFGATLQAADLAAFSALAGRPLGGAAAVELDLQSMPLDGTFDVALTGTTTDLAVNQPQADALLAGQTTLTLRAERDTNGTRLETLTLNNPALAVEASGDLTSVASNLRANIRLADAAILDPQLDGPVDVTALAGLASGAWNYTFEASGVGATVDATGTITGLDEPSPRITTETEADITDLARFSGLVGRDLAGSVDLRLMGFALTDGTVADVSVDATTRGARTGEARFDDLLVGRTDLSARVQRSGDTVTVPRFMLNGTGAGLRAEGAGQIEALTSDAPLIGGTVDFAANTLSRFSALAGRPLAGSVEGSATGSARLNGQEVDADLSLTARSVETGMADIDALLNGVVQLAGQVQRDGGTASIEGLDLSAQSMGLRLTGQAEAEEIDTAAPLIRVDAALRAEDIAPLSGLAGRQLGGAVDVTLEGAARADLTVLDVTLDGTTQDLRVGQENANRLLRGLTELGLTAARDGQAIRLPRLSITNDQVTLNGDGQYLPGESVLRADVSISDLRDLEPRMRGTAQVDLFAEEVDEVWQVTLDAAAADATLTANAQVRDALTGNPAVDGTATLRAADLSRFAPLVGRPLSGGLQADVSGNARADLSTFDVTADVTARSVTIGQAEADRLLAGQSDLRLVARRAGAGQAIRIETLRVDAPILTARADGTLLGSDANLNISARLADIGPFVTGLNGPVTVDGQVRSTGSQLGLDLSGTGPAGIAVRADGTVQQDFSRANLSLSGQAPLELANEFIQPRSVEGTLSFDIGVNGPLALSSISGRLTSQGARFVAPNLNLVLEQIALNASLNGSSLQLDVSGAKQGGGRIAVTGPIGLSGGFGADLAIDADGFVVEDPRLYRAILNGDISIVGPLTGGARIAGLVDIIEAELRIPSTGLGVTGPIPDGLVHVNEPADVRATRARAGLIDTGGGGGGGGRAVAFPLDLTVRATNRIFVRGRGLDAELGGALTLQGTTGDIIPAGQFDLLRGRLDILGQRLDMTEGSVQLQGDFSPTIRLVARTDAGDVAVFIIVEGSALEPEITFRSEPELPDEEVLARLLFGRSISSISPIQAAQLASAVATLAGRGGDGVVGRLRASTGLDDLDITTDEDGNAGVRAGKYLSENLYTDVTVGASGEAEINLNLDLSPSLTVKGSTSNTGDTSLGIYFERDY